MSQKPPVVVSVRESVGVLELDRPEKFNCLSPASHKALLDGINLLTSDSSVRSILVCSSGKHFCTGADLNAVKQSREIEDSLSLYIHSGHNAFRALELARVPTVVAVQGMCLAGGLELMLSCDVAFADTNAMFGDQHAAFGLIPGWGGSQRLPRLVGIRRALDLFYTARRINATVAEAWGLVNYVCSPGELRPLAFEYCRALSQRSAPGLSAMKRLAYDGADMHLTEGLALEAEVALPLLLGDDADEGLNAFEGRRQPAFSTLHPESLTEN